MQIEIHEKIIFLHLDIQKDKPSWVDSVFEGLTKIFPNKNILKVPNGHPIGRPKEDGRFLYVIRDSGLMMGVAKKLMEAKPGQMIPLTDKEMRAVANPYDFNIIPIPPVVEVDNA